MSGLPAAVIPSMPPDPARHERQLEAVLDIAWAISSTMSIEALLPLIMDLVTDIIDADRSTFFVVDGERQQLWSKVVQGQEVKEIRLSIGDGIAGWVAAHGDIINLKDAYTDARFDRSWDEISGYRTRSLLCVPIPDRDGGVIAVIQCLNKRGRSFDAEDEALLSSIGRQCAVAIENAFLYGEVLERNRALQRAERELRAAHTELEVLYGVERLIAESEDEAALVRAVVRGVCEHMGASSVALVLRAEEGGELHYGAVGGELRTLALDPAQLDATTVASASDGAPGEAQVSATLAVLREAGEQLPEGAALEADISDGHERLGTLYLLGHINGEDSEQAVLRTLRQVAVQAARGLSLLRKRDAASRAARLSVLGHSAAAILHDLRTPMTAVGGYVELMTMESDEPTRQGYADRVERALDHMNGMTQEIMAFARGQSELLRQKVYLHSFVDEVQEMLEPETKRFGVELQVEATYRGVARFDAGKVKRVLFNLARNACQAMGQGGHLTWRVLQAGDDLVFECADDGPGIPEAIRGRLFESFATHGKADGTGLGLAMARKIIRAHGGEIACESPPGQGATFRIRLPLAGA